MSARHSPFVLGKPIKEPADFCGRGQELRELAESIVNMQPVALVGEHRCGNTSLLYQLMHPEVQARHFPPGAAEGLLFTFFNCQLAAEAPESFFRRLARTLKRAHPESPMEPGEDVDPFWIEDFLEDLAGRDRRPVLLMDEFEVLAAFPPNFWEWFRGLIIEYDVSIVVATRVELGEFRDEWGTGSPFFNMFRSIYVGAFTEAELDEFLARSSEAGGLDLRPARAEILELAGRLPYYLQVAAALFYEQGLRDPALVGPAGRSLVEREFRGRVEPYFEDIWAKLPEAERDGLAWLALGSRPEAREALSFDLALPILERRGYVMAGRIFSSAFADFVRRQIPRIELNVETGAVRVEKRPVDLPPKEFALLRFFLAKAGEVVTKDDIAGAVWPEYAHDTLGVTDAMIQKTISRLRKEIDLVDAPFQHIESIRGQGYRFQNSSIFDFYGQAPLPASA